MNQRERTILQRLSRAVEGVPLPHDGSGTKTASVQGAFTFARDSRVLRQHHFFIIDSLLTGENNEAEKTVTALESWLETRRQAQWR